MHLEIPVGLRGKVLEMLVIWQEVPSNERWPEGWFGRVRVSHPFDDQAAQQYASGGLQIESVLRIARN